MRGAGDLEAAAVDLKAALALSPENASARSAVKTLRSRQKARDAADKAMFQKMIPQAAVSILGLTQVTTTPVQSQTVPC